MPGGDAREAAKTVTGSFEDFPFLPELPARGPGADMIGRTAGMLVELYARVEPSGWRLGDRPGRDTKRARSWLGEDLDALEEFTQGYEGPLKVQAVGPWTLAAALELRNGEAALSDPGACRDLAGSLAEGLRAAPRGGAPPGARRPARPPARRALPHRRAARPGEDRQRLPHPPRRRPAGRRGHAAGRRRRARAAARSWCTPARPTSPSRCCAGPGAAAVSFDFSLLTERDDDAIGEAVEGGHAAVRRCRARHGRPIVGPCR